MLSPAQVDHYRDHGFVAVPGAFSDDALSGVRREIEVALAAFSPVRHRSIFSTRDGDRGRDEVFFRSAERVECFFEEGALDDDGALNRPLDRAINKLGHALHDLLPAVGTLARDPRIGQALRALGQAEPMVWQSMAIFKQPGIGGAVRWHQDATYLFTEPASVIGVWIALEDATRDNGCLVVAPGAHRRPLKERYRVDWTSRRGTLETLDETPWPADDAAKPLEVPAGSIVFFHDHLPHASAANRSERSRLALTLHTADASRSTWSEANWLQRETLPPFRL